MRPAISARHARTTVAIAMAHSRANPNSAPACTAVEIDPASTNPPMLVTTPRTSVNIFFTAPLYQSHQRPAGECHRHSSNLVANISRGPWFAPSELMASRSRLEIATEPYWNESASFPTFTTLDGNLDVDVAVIGGGITGLTAAYLLSSSGHSVALLERARCAQIDTGHTSAHLTMVTDTRLSELRSIFGRTHAQGVWDAGLAAIAQIDDIIRELEIDCSFEWVDGYLHAPVGKATAKESDSFEDEAALAGE